MSDAKDILQIDVAEKAVRLLTGLKVPPVIARLIVSGTQTVGGQALDGALKRTDSFLRKHIDSYDHIKTFLEEKVFPPDSTQIQFDRLSKEFSDQFEEVFSKLGKLDVLFDELRKAPVQHILHLPQPVTLNPESPFSLLRAHNAFVPLLGRENEMKTLWRFLDEETPFRWLVITGEGGMGKSRLALEFAKQAASRGWAAGFLDASGLYSLVHHPNFPTWEPALDTLLIVDYAANKTEALLPLLEQAVRYSLLAQANNAAQLRILLLERQANPQEGWLKELLYEPEMDISDRLFETSWRFPYWELTPPGEMNRMDFARKLFREVERKWQLFFPKKETPNLNHLTDAEIEPVLEDTKGKPLYLLSAAISALHTNSLSGIKEWDWEALLDTLVHWERKHWDKTLDANNYPELAFCIRRAAAAMQFIGNVSNQKLKNFIKWDIERLGYTGSFSIGTVLDGLERVLTKDTENQLQPLSPDILAEAFAVATLQEKVNLVKPTDTIKKIFELTNNLHNLFLAVNDLKYVKKYSNVYNWIISLMEEFPKELQKKGHSILESYDRKPTNKKKLNLFIKEYQEYV